MKELFVPYELALKLKEKGFDEPCFAIYRDQSDDFGVTLISHGIEIYGSQSQSFYQNNDKYMKCLAPLYQQVVDWFREKHGIYIFVSPFSNYHVKNLQFITCLVFEGRYGREYKVNQFCPKDSELFNDYYECLTKAIEEALKLI